MKLVAGITVGRLTLLARDPDKKRNWICKCSCGNPTDPSIRDQSLSSGKSQSCGCLKLELLSARKTHGMSHTPTYKSWCGMWNRVRNDSEYIRRGITVCDRWLDFLHFLEDMGEKPDGYRISIERLDNDGNYEPGNCVWEGPAAQNRNKRDMIRIRIRSERFDTSKCPTEWAEILHAHTGNTRWNRRKLKSEIDLWGSIDTILQAAGITSLTAHSADDLFQQDELFAA